MGQPTLFFKTLAVNGKTVYLPSGYLYLDSRSVGALIGFIISYEFTFTGGTYMNINMNQDSLWLLQRNRSTTTAGTSYSNYKKDTSIYINEQYYWLQLYYNPSSRLLGIDYRDSKPAPSDSSSSLKITNIVCVYSSNDVIMDINDYS